MDLFSLLMLPLDSIAKNNEKPSCQHNVFSFIDLTEDLSNYL